MRLVFALLDWRSGAKWMPYLFAILVLLGLYVALFLIAMAALQHLGAD